MEAPIKIKRHLNRQAALINRWFSSYPTKLQETHINKTPEIRQESSDISGTWLIITYGIKFPAEIKLRIAEDWHFKIKAVFLAWISIDDLQCLIFHSGKETELVFSNKLTVFKYSSAK